MQARALCGVVGAIVAVDCLLAIAPAARAQDVRITAPAVSAAGGETEMPLTTEESVTLGRALVFDPADLASGKTRTLRVPGLPKPGGLDVNRTDNPDGSSKIAVKHPVPVDLDSAAVDATVGADVNFAAPPPTVFQPGQPLPGAAASDTGSSAAWASVGVPNLASVDARVDPANEQGKVGGKLSHSVPIGKKLSITLEDSYSMTETLSASTAAPAPVPPPAVAPVTTTPAPEVFDSSRSVKFNIAPTGTTFGAGVTTASNDPVTHHTLSADQKLFGPLHVTTAATDVGQPTENKSITAGFKLTW